MYINKDSRVVVPTTHCIIEKLPSLAIRKCLVNKTRFLMFQFSRLVLTKCYDANRDGQRVQVCRKAREDECLLSALS
jgi:hypothetical protein